MGERPAGTVTFVFTDIESSTRRWQDHTAEMREALQRHDAVLADRFEGAGGRVFKHTGDGMCAAFASATAALAAAVEAQQRLAAESWDAVGGLAVRMALHTGEAHERDGDYFGPALNRVARILGLAHGGQVLVSGATAALVAGEGAVDAELVDVGEHSLRDLDRPERLYQVVAPGLPTEFPPLASGGAVSRGLPVARSSFVGRESDLDEIMKLIEATTLVTLVGIGGAGKTRLAMEVASRARSAWEEVHFIELAPLADGRQIPGAIATSLGISVGGPGAGSVTDVVMAALARRPTLLVLDNCEHLVDDCADLVDELLDRCPELSVLATSREALSVEGERTWSVPSLPSEDAVRLFVDRAVAADAHFRLDPETESVVADICRRLDGIPLAIELAASRVTHLSPAELASRLDDRFRLLTGGRRRRAQRQQTLQAAIDWSHELLDEDERRLLRRLSVFAGGFTLEAAERVCAGDGIERRQIVDLLGSLVAKSLVLAEYDDAATRYRMLETIRLYAADRLLDAGEVEPFRDRHRDYWLAWVEDLPVDEAVCRRDAGELFEAEIDNLRAALDWSESQDGSDLAVRQAVAMGSLWTLFGHHDEGQARLSGLVESPDLEPALRAEGLAVLSAVRMTSGDFDGMDDVAHRSVALEPDGRLAALAYVYESLFRVFEVTRFPEAHELLAAARRVADLHDQPMFHELADGLEAHFFLVEGELDRPVALARSTPPRPTFSEVNLRSASIAALIEQEDPEAALVEVEVMDESWGSQWSAPLRSVVMAELGRVDDARRYVRIAIGHYLDQPFPLVDRDCLVSLAAIALAEGEPARAAELLETVIADRGLAGFRSPSTFVVWRRLRRRTKQALAPDVYDLAKARGRAVAPLDALHREAARL